MRGEPVVQRGGRYRGPVAEGQQGAGVEHGGHDVVVDGEGAGGGGRHGLEQAADDDHVIDATGHDGGVAEPVGRRTPRGGHPVHDRVEVVIHAGRLRPSGFEGGQRVTAVPGAVKAELRVP